MPLTSPQFNDAYKKLNPKQREAVDKIDGPIMVVAGPGTGKTQILATRIANILTKTDTNPSSILALTFTESGAAAMRQRLISLIGQTGYYVHISTFHSFCADVIRENPENFPLPADAESLSELERFELFSTIITDHDLQVLKPINSPEYYVKAIIKSISDLKREGINPDEFEKIIAQEEQDLASTEYKKTEKLKREKNFAKHKELLLIYRSYQDLLKRNGRFDFDDMIALVSDAFGTNELLLLEYQEKYQYILVDEYQDTNGAQADVMNLLASYWGEEANLFVVGDINQSIYRFQGASAENVLNFLKKYPEATVIHLEENYRSTQLILDVATGVIAHNHVRLDTLTGHEHSLHSQLSIGGEKICILEPSSGQLEVVSIAERIKKLIEKGASPSDIAIIYRHNDDSLAISTALAKWGIPYDIDGGVNILTTPIISQLLLLLQTIQGIKTGLEDLDLFTLLSFEWTGLDSLAILRITRDAAKRRMQILDVILEQVSDESKRMLTNAKQMDVIDQSRLFDESPTSELDIQDTKYEIQDTKTQGQSKLNANHNHVSQLPHNDGIFNIDDYMPEDFVYSNDPMIAKVQRFVTQLIGLLNAESNHTFVQWFEYVLTTTGFLPHLLARPSVIEDLNRVNSLFNEIKRLASLDHTLNLERFLHIIETMNSHKLTITEDDQNLRKHSVRLTTAHKSKGQEWKHVFIMSVIDKKWGNNTSRELLPLPEGILQTQDTSKKDQNEDERRLFYVALTRAKHEVTISIPQTVLSGGTSKDTVPSIFLTEIDPQCTKKDTLEELESNQQVLLERLLSPRPPVIVSSEERDFLQDAVSSFKLSPTSLDTYLKCPYKFKLNHLLKVPRAKTEHQALGTAVHAALERYFLRFQKTDKLPDLEFLLTEFESALRNELLTVDVERIRIRQGKAMLTRYYEHYHTDFSKPLFCERLFGYGWSKTMLDDIALTGKVDRIDWLDETMNTVAVVDYKTGKPRSRNEIEGLTGKKDPAYKRQLVFYKLLTQLDRTFTAKAENFVLDFIEPDKQSGKHKRESFSISQQEVDELEELIKGTMKEIRALNFEHTRDTSICGDCEFAKHCWPEGIPAQRAE